jgi:putrescine aminotransferase
MTIPANKSEIMEKYSRYISKTRLTELTAYGLPLVLTARKGVQVIDSEGKAYYDCFCSGGQQVLGNTRLEVEDAFREALKHYDLGNFVLMSAQKSALARLLAEMTPENLKHTVFGVGRGEANDFALKLARGATGRSEIICFEGAAHGQTGFALSASDNRRREELFGPLIPGVKRIPIDASAIEEAITNQTAAVIVEPIQSDNGVKIMPTDILKIIRSQCSRHGAAFILDEGQTSLGRSGVLFSCLRDDIKPDILTIAKGMGGTYYPISATIFTPRLNRFMLTHTLIHLSTFGGADLGCMVAISCLEVIRKNRLWENAAERGRQLKKGLNDIAAGKPGLFKAMRGEGLLLGLETEDETTAGKYVSALAAGGLIALITPLNSRVIRFTPPIDITAEQVDQILEVSAAAAKKL